MEALRTLYIIALCYRATKATAVELAECFAEVSHDAFTRLLGTSCRWQKRLWQEVTQRLPLRGGWLELDDTVLDKFGTAIWGVAYAIAVRTSPIRWPRSVSQSSHGQLRGAYARATAPGSGSIDDRLVGWSADILSALSAKREQPLRRQRLARIPSANPVIAARLKTAPSAN